MSGDAKSARSREPFNRLNLITRQGTLGVRSVIVGGRRPKRFPVAGQIGGDDGEALGEQRPPRRATSGASPDSRAATAAAARRRPRAHGSCRRSVASRRTSNPGTSGNATRLGGEWDGTTVWRQTLLSVATLDNRAYVHQNRKKRGYWPAWTSRGSPASRIACPAGPQRPSAPGIAPARAGRLRPVGAGASHGGAAPRP